MSSMCIAADKYTRHSVYPYTGTTADNKLAPRQNQVVPGNGTTCGKIGLAANVLICSFCGVQVSLQPEH